MNEVAYYDSLGELTGLKGNTIKRYFKYIETKKGLTLNDSTYLMALKKVQTILDRIGETGPSSYLKKHLLNKFFPGE
ncbi:hypothetical protein [Daejeonella sp.]|uniref:hypothetical protein n=1 Tax=Daejeonella sp. TaxID=2805397 RepID=UPI003C721931